MHTKSLYVNKKKQQRGEKGAKTRIFFVNIIPIILINKIIIIIKYILVDNN